MLVNCSSVEVVRPLLEGLAAVQVPFGVYGNVGEPDDVTGWRNDGDARPGPYAEAARAWIEAGATIVGGCCGTTPAHIAALAELAPGGSPVE